MAGRVKTVLVVDDDASLRLLCRVNLELEGYRVLEAATVQGARDLLASERIDVVLLDVHVGDGDGLDLLVDVREEQPEAGIALFTGSAELGAETRALADGVLSKPFALEDLARVVSRLASSPADVDSGP